MLTPKRFRRVGTETGGDRRRTHQVGEHHRDNPHRHRTPPPIRRRARATLLLAVRLDPRPDRVVKATDRLLRCLPPAMVLCASRTCPTGGSPTSAARVCTPATSRRPWSTSAITSRCSADSPTRCSMPGCRSSKLPEPRHLQRHLPRPLPGVLGDQALAGPRRDRPVLDRPLQRAARVQPEGLALPRAPQARLRPRPRQPVPGLRHLGDRPVPPGARDPAPPDHEGSGSRGRPRPEREEAPVGQPLVRVREDAGEGRSPLAPGCRRVGELDQRHPHRLRGAPPEHAPRAGRRRSRAVQAAGSRRPRARPPHHDRRAPMSR